MKRNILTTLVLTAFAAPALSQPMAPAAAVAHGSIISSSIAAKLFPDGIYRRMLGDTFTTMISGMMGRMGDIPVREIMRAAGGDEAVAAKLDKATVNKVMAIIDPAYHDRMRLMIDGMFKGMIPVFEQMEPELREGLAESLDHRFTPAQLGELKTFFDTPTGNSYASQQMLLFMDPAVMGRMQAQMPKIMQSMPAMFGEAAKATAGLPKAKKYADLTAAERTELATLLGIAPEKMKK
ncbi:MAG: hypothetical protein ABI898_04550 [Sphingomonadales bacterium]